MEITESKLKKILREQRVEFQKYTKNLKEDFERYTGGLKESFDDKLDAITEYVKDIPAIKEKQSEMSDRLDQIATNIDFIKVVVKDHEERIQKLETR